MIKQSRTNNKTMAYNKNTKNTTGNNKTQHHPIHDCKVCVDAGKSPEECASHYVRDRAGNVTCPTLLNQKCLLCGVCGHTASYCKTSTKTTTTTKEPTKETKAPARIQPKPQPAKERPQCSNKYAILGLLEAEAERVKEQLVVAFPPLDPKPEHSRPSTATTATKSSAISTWASRLKSPPSPFSQHSEQDEKQQQQQQQRRKPTKPVAIAVSWADY
jgi:hypothetical protein